MISCGRSTESIDTLPITGIIDSIPISTLPITSMSKKKKVIYVSDCCESSYAIDPDSIDTGCPMHICDKCGQDCEPIPQDDFLGRVLR